MLLLCLISNVWANPPIITCERQRYFENEKIQCTLKPLVLKAPATQLAHITLNVLGKETRVQTIPLLYGASSSMQFQPPAPLRSVTPLEIRAQLTRENSNEALKVDTVALQIFPEESRFWVGENEFKGKIIFVDKAASWVCVELEAMNIPFELESGRDLQKIKRADFRFTAANTEDFDRQDPWTRWELVQRLRKGLGAPESPKDGEVKS